jgi:antitoxin component of RelBE/YafQ-DinJ toxin-antitoxin module
VVIEMSKQQMDQTLMAVRVTPSFKAEVQKIAEKMGIPQSVFIRSSIKIVIEEPNLLSEIMEKWKTEHDGKDRE